MNKEELIKIYSAYLPYELRICDLLHNPDFILDEDNLGDVLHDAEHLKTIKPYLYDLSYLTKEIEHEGKIFIPVDFFEIGDDDSGIEYDHGNIKLIKELEHISKNKAYHDIQFLPFEVVQRLISWKINIFGLKEDQFINKATLTEAPCEKKE